MCLVLQNMSERVISKGPLLEYMQAPCYIAISPPPLAIV